jgi:hypothetical protein
LTKKPAAWAHRIAIDPFVADLAAAPAFDGVVHTNHHRLAVRHERLQQQAKQDPLALWTRRHLVRQEPMEQAESFVRGTIHRSQHCADRVPVQAQQGPGRQRHHIQPRWLGEHRRER